MKHGCIDINSLPPLRQVVYVISIWSECQPNRPSLWHGSLKTAAGQQFDFSTLDELNHLLCELGGWMDPLRAATNSNQLSRALSPTSINSA